MIASVDGVVGRVGLDRVVVEVGGIGILVRTTPATVAGLRPGATTRLATSLVVREDSLTLYGFADEDGREVFEVVQSVAGIGPRLALAMLSVHSPDTLRAAIAAGDVATLTKVPGIGRKGAERLLLELRDRIGVPATPAPGAQLPAAGWRGPVAEALVGLGWTARQAQGALDDVAAGLGEDPEVPTALRAALRELGR